MSRRSLPLDVARVWHAVEASARMAAMAVKSGNAGAPKCMDGQRLTARLKLKPIDGADADQLWQLYQDLGIARWYAGAWSIRQAREFAMEKGRAWQVHGVGKWPAHRREDATLIGRGGSSVAIHNLRSRAVMERLGMTYVHDFNSPGQVEGSESVHDNAVFVLYEITP